MFFMRKTLPILLICLFLASINAQDFSISWKDHFSFLNIKDISIGTNKIYAASENALFSYDIESKQIDKLTTVQGLSGELISTIYYSQNSNIVLIGYTNGLIEVYTEQDNQILTVVDIINKQNIPSGEKKINHFNESNGIVYISTDYGISVYDLDNLEFGDSYFIGNGGAQTDITQTTILGDYIYASSNSSTGIKRALVESQNLIDFNEWEQFRSETLFSAVQSIGDELYATRGSVLYHATPGVFNNVGSYTSPILKLNEVDENLVVVTKEQVDIYNQEFELQDTFTPSLLYDSDFTSAVFLNDDVYIGTTSHGVLNKSSQNNQYLPIYPEGPLRNNSFSISAGFNQVWLTFGDYTFTYNPSPLRRYGLSYLSNGEWRNVSYDSIKQSIGTDAYNLNAISVNPLNPSQVFVSSFHSGLLELNNGEPTQFYNETNSGLESLIFPPDPNYKSIRIGGSQFDENGLLWVLNSVLDTPLKAFNLNTNQWQSYSVASIISDPLSNLGFIDLEISNEGIIWVTSSNDGLFAFDINSNRVKNIFGEEVAQLPRDDIRALALDNRNQLWIGTSVGLRVLYNTTLNFFDDPVVETQPIIFLEDGIPKELLERQFIKDIEVDGSNNKWIATIGSGAFYLTSDGQETIYHFTKDNSPLPSNNVNDISIDSDNGAVYFATENGLVSFNYGGSKPQEVLTNAYVYPNPVRPEFNMLDQKVKIKDISENCNIKITDIEGNLVTEATSQVNSRYNNFNLEIDGGTAYWNGRNLANNTVASGVYLIMISDLDSFETKVLKLMIIR